MSEELTLFDIETGLLDLLREREELIEGTGLGVDEGVDRLKAVATLDLAIREHVAAEIRKADGIAYYMREFEARQEAEEAEVARLKERAEKWKKRRERLEEITIAVMRAAGKDRIEGQHNTLKLRKNPPSVEVSQPDLVPEDLMRRTVTVTEEQFQKIVQAIPDVKRGNAEPIKSEIGKRMKAGEAVAGCSLITDKVRLIVE